MITREDDTVKIDFNYSAVKNFFGGVKRMVLGVPVHGPRVVNAAVNSGGAIAIGAAGGIAESTMSLIRTTIEAGKRGYNQPMSAVKLVAVDADGNTTSLFDNVEPKDNPNVNKIALGTVSDLASMISQAQKSCRRGGQFAAAITLGSCHNRLEEARKSIKAGKPVDIDEVSSMALSFLAPYLNENDVAAATDSLICDTGTGEAYANVKVEEPAKEAQA